MRVDPEQLGERGPRRRLPSAVLKVVDTGPSAMIATRNTVSRCSLLAERERRLFKWLLFPFHQESCVVFMVLRHDKWPWRGRRPSDRGWSCPSRPPMGTSPTRARSSHLQGWACHDQAREWLQPILPGGERSEDHSPRARSVFQQRARASPGGRVTAEVLLIHTGGTIASKVDYATVPSPPGSSQRRSCTPCPS